MEKALGHKEEVAATKLDGFDWSAHQMEVEAIPIKDANEGEKVVIRHFFFKANPEQKRGSKQDIVRSFQKLIEISLWGDGFVPVFEQPMEVHTRRSVKKVSPQLYKKLLENHADFVIQVLAKPRKGQMWSIHNPAVTKI